MGKAGAGGVGDEVADRVIETTGVTVGQVLTDGQPSNPSLTEFRDTAQNTSINTDQN